MGRRKNTTTVTSDPQIQVNEDSYSHGITEEYQFEIYKIYSEINESFAEYKKDKPNLQKLKNELDKSKDEFESAKDEFESAKDEFEKDKKNIQDALKKSQDSIVQIIGTFVALFTFVSGEIKIFQEIESGYLGIALSLFLLGSLLVFSFCLKILFSKKEDGDSYVLVSGMIIFFVSLYLFYLYQGQYYARQEILDNMKSQLSTTTQEVKDNIASTTELREQINSLYERNPYLKK